MFVTCLFKLALGWFVGKAKSIPWKGASLGYYLLANIRLGWKGLPGINTLAFYNNL